MPTSPAQAPLSRSDRLPHAQQVNRGQHRHRRGRDQSALVPYYVSWSRRVSFSSTMQWWLWVSFSYSSTSASSIHGVSRIMNSSSAYPIMCCSYYNADCPHRQVPQLLQCRLPHHQSLLQGSLVPLPHPQVLKLNILHRRQRLKVRIMSMC
jgi:hypothetical protein